MASLTDWMLTRASHWHRRCDSPQIVAGFPCRHINTSQGNVRVLDTGITPNKPTLVLAPDGPAVIEHYASLIDRLRHYMRIVVFDFPGFGFSMPSATYGHSVDEGALVILDILEALALPKASLAFSCSNGFYALRAASLAPHRIACLVLSQTPCVDDMRKWSTRVVPAPVPTPVIGQLVTWWGRRANANLWYKIALPSKSPMLPVLQQVATTAIDEGGCYCLASVVQGMAASLPAPSAATTPSVTPAATKLTVPVSLPVHCIWGGKDRSHAGTPSTSILATVPHAEVVHWPDCGHCPDLEYTSQWVELVRPWVLTAWEKTPSIRLQAKI
jgi:pimeloyl-ACP methyl ester carboxylesterase